MRTLHIKSEVTFTVHEIAILKDRKAKLQTAGSLIASSSYRRHSQNASVQVQRLDTENGYSSLSIWSGYNAKVGAESNVRLILSWDEGDDQTLEQGHIEFDLNKICHGIDRQSDLKPIVVIYLLREVEIRVMMHDLCEIDEKLPYFTARLYFEEEEEMQEFLQLIELYAFIERAAVQSMALMDFDDIRGPSRRTRSQL